MSSLRTHSHDRPPPHIVTGWTVHFFTIKNEVLVVDLVNKKIISEEQITQLISPLALIKPLI